MEFDPFNALSAGFIIGVFVGMSLALKADRTRTETPCEKKARLLAEERMKDNG